MNKVRASNPLLDGLIPYDPKYIPARVMLSANENPQSIPEPVLKAVLDRLSGLDFNRYPDPLANDLRDAIAQVEGLDRNNVLMGNGGDELLFDLALAWGGAGRKMLNIPPTFSVYKANAYLTGTDVVEVPRRDDYSIDEQAVIDRLSAGDIDFAIITSPNNPTGTVASRDFLIRVLECTDALIMVDEAYCEFSRQTIAPLVREHKNLLVLRTFSKAYSLAGARMGYILADPEVITEFVKVRQPYSVDAVSQAIALEVVRNRDLFQDRIDRIIEQRGVLAEGLAAIEGVRVYPSDANYLLVRLEGIDAGEVWQQLLDRGYLVRDFSRSAGLENCLRITVGLPEENEGLIRALAQILKG